MLPIRWLTVNVYRKVLLCSSSKKLHSGRKTLKMRLLCFSSPIRFSCSFKTKKKTHQKKTTNPEINSNLMETTSASSTCFRCTLTVKRKFFLYPILFKFTILGSHTSQLFLLSESSYNGPRCRYNSALYLTGILKFFFQKAFRVSVNIFYWQKISDTLY